MKFHKEFMQNVAYDDEPTVVKVEDDIVDNSRWSIHHAMIFKIVDESSELNGRYFQSAYSVGATEQQEEQPYEYAGDGEGMILCEEVELVEKLVKVWKVKND